MAGPAWQFARRSRQCRASGLSGAQCHGLVGPKMPIAGVADARPRHAEGRNRSTPRRWRRPAPGWHCADRGRSDRARLALVRSPAISAASAFSSGPPRTQTCTPLAGQAAGQLRIAGERPSLRRPDGARRQRHRRPVGRRCRSAAASRPPRSAGTTSSGCGHSAGRALAVRQRQRGAAVDHARQRPLAPAQVVEQAEAGLADEPGPLRDAGQKRRQRRFPGARHHQGMAIAFRRKPLRQRAVPAKGQLLARQIRPRCPYGRPACSRPAATPCGLASTSTGRPGKSLVQQPDRRCDSERSRRSTCRGQAGSGASVGRFDLARSMIVNL